MDLAVSLIVKPPLIFLDEPTTGLDPRTRGEMWDVIRSLANDGATILLTTQYLEEADQLADTKAMMKLLSSLTQHEIGVKEFSVRKPTLDEVFLELTK